MLSLLEEGCFVLVWPNEKVLFSSAADGVGGLDRTVFSMTSPEDVVNTRFISLGASVFCADDGETDLEVDADGWPGKVSSSHSCQRKLGGVDRMEKRMNWTRAEMSMSKGV